MDSIRERITSEAEQCRDQLPQKFMELDEFLRPKMEQALSANMNLSVSESSSNDEMAQLFNRTRQELAFAISSFGVLETWLKLCIPKEEDGNNFGVAIVLHAIKIVVESKKELSDLLKELPTYYKERGDAAVKISKKSSSSKTETKKNTEKDGSAAEAESSVVVEQKEVSDAVHPDLVKAVETIDSVWFLRLCNTCNQIRTNYAAVLDYLSKNEDKISSPKGSGGGGMSMF
eukprot:CAMPEP_0185743330 /NCGR_PEP_ID=MMETSP1174-20130828/1033_1 /TAXON_ID=35687 /ORGANISM="Dictyocha speculum, Strain CCMP1381" /LENGTH=230 /DNA_ID=CAMNT_0028415935 /DNA_START=90 /DNA_END=782 /DNA_ORIENTATION=+